MHYVWPFLAEVFITSFILLFSFSRLEPSALTMRHHSCGGDYICVSKLLLCLYLYMCCIMNIILPITDTHTHSHYISFCTAFVSFRALASSTELRLHTFRRRRFVFSFRSFFCGAFVWIACHKDHYHRIYHWMPEHTLTHIPSYKWNKCLCGAATAVIVIAAKFVSYISMQYAWPWFPY